MEQGDNAPIEYGVWETIRKGREIAVLAVGKMNQAANEAANRLREEGFEIELVNCRFIKPMDTLRLDALFSEFDHIITVEDNYKSGGFGAAVLEYAAEKGYGGKVSVIGFPDEFIAHGSPSKLYQAYGLDADGIYRHMKKRIRGEANG